MSEPCFVIRGSDRHGAALLWLFAELAAMEEGGAARGGEAMKAGAAMTEWRREQGLAGFGTEEIKRLVRAVFNLPAEFPARKGEG